MGSYILAYGEDGKRRNEQKLLGAGRFVACRYHLFASRKTSRRTSKEFVQHSGSRGERL